MQRLVKDTTLGIKNEWYGIERFSNQDNSQALSPETTHCVVDALAKGTRNNTNKNTRWTNKLIGRRDRAFSDHTLTTTASWHWLWYEYIDTQVALETSVRTHLYWTDCFQSLHSSPAFNAPLKEPAVSKWNRFYWVMTCDEGDWAQVVTVTGSG